MVVWQGESPADAQVCVCGGQIRGGKEGGKMLPAKTRECGWSQEFNK